MLCISYLVPGISFLLSGCLVNEGASRSPSRQAISFARYDKGIVSTNQNAAAWERGYYNR